MLSQEDAHYAVGEGWAGLIDQLFSRLPQGAYVVAIKEKWGGLRVSVIGADRNFYDFLDDLEGQSLTICEICGEPGEPRPRGWVKTLCDFHALQ